MTEVKPTKPMADVVGQSQQQVSPSKVVIVTGAGSGIGRTVTRHLLNNNCHVVLAGRRVPQLQDTVSAGCSPEPTSGKALCVQTDVTHEDSVRNLFRQTIERFGRVDVLFNNAGITFKSVLLEDLALEQWQQLVDVNLTGSFLCTREAFRVMKQQQPQGGRIINNGSVSAVVPRRNSVAYTASKHAITGLTKSTALDGRKYNIACSQIDIGNAATDMTTGMSSGVHQADGSIAREPTMDAQHVADAVLMMVKLPPEANIANLTIMATQMPFVGRG